MNIAELVHGKHSIVVLTGELRWRGGVLEQELAYQDYENGKLVGQRYGWRPVPAVDPATDA